MKLIPIIVVMSVLFFLCTALSAQENPFLQMTDKPYREYYAELDKQAYQLINLHEQEDAACIVARMRDAARQSNDKRWTLEADFFECAYRFHHTLWIQRDSLRKVEGREGEKLIPCLLPLLQHAEKAGYKELSIRICDKILNVYFCHIRNYELGFRYCRILDNLLSKVSVTEFPLKPAYYMAIERWYSRFGEYETAESFCYKAIEDPVAAYKASHSLEHALNDLGVIYRNHYQDYAKSDSCFNEILRIRLPDTTDEEVRLSMKREQNLWTYIAKGQIGSNYYLRGDYDTSIPLLVYAVEKIPAHNPYNYSYVAGKALILAEIYIRKNNLIMAGKYLDSAYVYIQRAPEDGLWQSYYPMVTRYYGAIGNTELALAYMDSTLNAQSRYEDDFNLRKLYRAEQRLKQEELDVEKLRSQTYQRIVLILSVFASIIIALSGLLFYFYRQKRAAYRTLAQRIQQWAEQTFSVSFTLPAAEITSEVVDVGYVEVKSGSAAEEAVSGSDDANRRLFEKLEQLFLSEKLYLHPDISLEYAADRLGINRSRLSCIVNSFTGKNFNVYVNEYRVKEAVRILSSGKTTNLSLEGVAFESGFNNRKTFHEAFKKITGLSPSVFRYNQKKE